MDKYFPLVQFLASSLHHVLKTVMTLHNFYGLNLKKPALFSAPSHISHFCLDSKQDQELDSMMKLEQYLY